MPKEALSQPHEGVWLDVEGEVLELAVHQRQGLVGSHVVLRLSAGHTNTSHAHDLAAAPDERSGGSRCQQEPGWFAVGPWESADVEKLRDDFRPLESVADHEQHSDHAAHLMPEESRALDPEVAHIKRLLSVGWRGLDCKGVNRAHEMRHVPAQRKAIP